MVSYRGCFRWTAIGIDQVASPLGEALGKPVKIEARGIAEFARDHAAAFGKR